MDHEAVVNALGGRTKLAARLRVGASAVSNWLRDGFPKSRIPDLLKIAEEDNVEGVTLDVLRSLASKGLRATAVPAPQSEAA